MIVSNTIFQEPPVLTGKSKFKALAQAIREGIVSGQLQPEAKLPPVRELAYQIGVTPGTVARAYQLLTDEGRLRAVVGRGTFVAGSSQRSPYVPSPAILVADDRMAQDAQVAHLLSPKMPDVGQGQMIRDGLRHLAETMPAEHLLRYPDRQTDLAARQAIAAYLGADRVGAYTVEDIVTAHGGQSAIVMILQTILHGARPVVAVDALSYGGFRYAAAMCRADVVAVSWDREGPDPAAFEALIKAHGVQVFCTSSEVCNPTVRHTTPARRQEIAQIAQRYGVHVVDDDCYRLMRARALGPSYRALLPDLGWHVVSPAKSISAALRIGFALAPQGWTSALVRTATFSSFGVTRLMTDLYAHLLAQPGIDHVLDAVRDRIGQDVRAAVNALGMYKLNWSEDVPFIWLELPLGWRSGEFLQAADAAGVLIKSADDFALRDGRSVHAVRIAINGLVPHQNFVDAMQVLRDLLADPPQKIPV
jgi:DNA-binding transcriptional MocR family regulator